MRSWPVRRYDAAMGTPIRPDQLEKTLRVGGIEFKNMLPTGMHCQACHGLVKVEEAYVGLSVEEFNYLFDRDSIMILLRTHAEFTCRKAELSGPLSPGLP